jgi:hypothetical protein
MSTQPSITSNLDALARLGVPTFVLVVILFLAVPRADATIDKLQRIETQLAVLAATCEVGSPTVR